MEFDLNAVFITITTRDGVEHPMWLNNDFETFVVGRQYLYHALPESPDSEHPGMNAFRCYYPKENLPVNTWIDIGLAARDAGLESFPFVVIHNSDGLLIFDTFGLANNHRYEYPYVSNRVSLTGGEVPKISH